METNYFEECNAFHGKFASRTKVNQNDDDTSVIEADIEGAGGSKSDGHVRIAIDYTYDTLSSNADFEPSQMMNLINILDPSQPDYQKGGQSAVLNEIKPMLKGVLGYLLNLNRKTKPPSSVPKPIPRQQKNQPDQIIDSLDNKTESFKIQNNPDSADFLKAPLDDGQFFTTITDDADKINSLSELHSQLEPKQNSDDNLEVITNKNDINDLGVTAPTGKTITANMTWATPEMFTFDKSKNSDTHPTLSPAPIEETMPEFGEHLNGLRITTDTTETSRPSTIKKLGELDRVMGFIDIMREQERLLLHPDNPKRPSVHKFIGRKESWLSPKLKSLIESESFGDDDSSAQEIAGTALPLNLQIKTSTERNEVELAAGNYTGYLTIGNREIVIANYENDNSEELRKKSISSTQIMKHMFRKMSEKLAEKFEISADNSTTKITSKYVSEAVYAAVHEAEQPSDSSDDESESPTNTDTSEITRKVSSRCVKQAVDNAIVRVVQTNKAEEIYPSAVLENCISIDGDESRILGSQCAKLAVENAQIRLSQAETMETLALNETLNDGVATEFVDEPNPSSIPPYDAETVEDQLVSNNQLSDKSNDESFLLQERGSQCAIAAIDQAIDRVDSDIRRSQTPTSVFTLEPPTQCQFACGLLQPCKLLSKVSDDSNNQRPSNNNIRIINQQVTLHAPPPSESLNNDQENCEFDLEVNFSMVGSVINRKIVSSPSCQLVDEMAVTLNKTSGKLTVISEYLSEGSQEVPPEDSVENTKDQNVSSSTGLGILETAFKSRFIEHCERKISGIYNQNVHDESAECVVANEPFQSSVVKFDKKSVPAHQYNSDISSEVIIEPDELPTSDIPTPKKRQYMSENKLQLPFTSIIKPNSETPSRFLSDHKIQFNTNFLSQLANMNFSSKLFNQIKPRQLNPRQPLQAKHPNPVVLQRRKRSTNGQVKKNRNSSNTSHRDDDKMSKAPNDTNNCSSTVYRGDAFRDHLQYRCSSNRKSHAEYKNLSSLKSFGHSTDWLQKFGRSQSLQPLKRQNLPFYSARNLFRPCDQIYAKAFKVSACFQNIMVHAKPNKSELVLQKTVRSVSTSGVNSEQTRPLIRPRRTLKEQKAKLMYEKPAHMLIAQPIAQFIVPDDKTILSDDSMETAIDNWVSLKQVQPESVCSNSLSMDSFHSLTQHEDAVDISLDNKQVINELSILNTPQTVHFPKEVEELDIQSQLDTPPHEVSLAHMPCVRKATSIAPEAVSHFTDETLSEIGLLLAVEDVQPAISKCSDEKINSSKEMDKHLESLEISIFLVYQDCENVIHPNELHYTLSNNVKLNVCQCISRTTQFTLGILAKLPSVLMEVTEDTDLMIEKCEPLLDRIERVVKCSSEIILMHKKEILDAEAPLDTVDGLRRRSRPLDTFTTKETCQRFSHLASYFKTKNWLRIVNSHLGSGEYLPICPPQLKDVINQKIYLPKITLGEIKFNNRSKCLNIINNCKLRQHCEWRENYSPCNGQILSFSKPCQLKTVKYPNNSVSILSKQISIVDYLQSRKTASSTLNAQLLSDLQASEKEIAMLQDVGFHTRDKFKNLSLLTEEELLGGDIQSTAMCERKNDMFTKRFETPNLNTIHWTPNASQQIRSISRSLSLDDIHEVNDNGAHVEVALRTSRNQLSVPKIPIRSNSENLHTHGRLPFEFDSKGDAFQNKSEMKKCKQLYVKVRHLRVITEPDSSGLKVNTVVNRTRTEYTMK